MVSRSSGVGQRETISPKDGKGVWFIGDYAGDIGTYAFCLTLAGRPDESYRLLDHPEKYENGFIVRVPSYRSNNYTRGENARGRMSIVINLSFGRWTE